MFSLLNKTKYSPVKKLIASTGLSFESIKNAILGPDYELSLVFVDTIESHKINLTYRKKDKPTNILSFPLDDMTGEIFICPEYAAEEAHLFERDFDNYIMFLLIHGLVHLKGFDHGSKMEAEEQKFRKKFGI